MQMLWGRGNLAKNCKQGLEGILCEDVTLGERQHVAYDNVIWTNVKSEK